MTKLRWQSARRRVRQPASPPEKGVNPWPWTRYLFLVILFLTLLIVITAMMIEKRVSPALHAWAETRAVNLAGQAIHAAVEKAMTADMNPDELAATIVDDGGRLQAIKYNTSEINRISAAAALMVLEHLTDLGTERFTIPLGQFFGLDFLSGFGPGIPLRVVPAGAVAVTPVSSFISAGINQTIHRLYLDIQVEMRIVVPLAAATHPVTARIPIVEDIIVGAVPSWYFAPSGLVGGFEQYADFSGSQQQIEFRLNEP